MALKWTFSLIDINTLRPRQNGRRFANNTFKRTFLNENVRISIKISLKFVHKGPINNNPALVQIMAWRRSGDKPLSEPMMVSLLTQICVTRPQWVNPSSWGYSVDITRQNQTGQHKPWLYFMNNGINFAGKISCRNSTTRLDISVFKHDEGRVLTCRCRISIWGVSIIEATKLHPIWVQCCKYGNSCFRKVFADRIWHWLRACLLLLGNAALYLENSIYWPCLHMP